MVSKSSRRGTGAWVAGAGLALLGAGAFAAYQRFMRAPLPKTEGVQYKQGIYGRIEVIRDSWGIPHIYADHLYDTIWAQGYVHTQDRLWQMELIRRAAAGTLSEILGPVTFDLDRWMRQVGVRRAAQQDYSVMGEREAELLDAYVRGVNAGIEDAKGRLPLEFTLLGTQPATWTALDSITIYKLHAFTLGNNWFYELMRARLVAKLGAERAAFFEPATAAPHTMIMPADVSPEDYRKIHTDILDIFSNSLPYLGAADAGASNSWVIAPHRSASGNAILANDPHLMVQMPSIWYEIHLHVAQAPLQQNTSGPALNVTGGSFPGTPLVEIGHNDHIAWGITASSADVQDLYLERRHPDNPLLFEYQGTWERAQIEREEIRIKGQPAHIEEVVVTRHGPVISPLKMAGVPNAEEPLSLSWSGHTPGTTYRAALLLNLAHNWDDFSAAMEAWDDPALNFVYADTEGNIGYRLAGKIPIRPRGAGLLPLPGWTGEYEWQGYIPKNELPSAYNPPEGVIATANNQIVSRDYPYELGYDWDSGYRAQRIVEMLDGQTHTGISDCRRMQLDTLSIPARHIQEYLQPLTTDDPRLRTALDMLLLWDARMDEDSVAAAIYAVWEQKFQERVFGPLLGDLAEVYFRNALREKAMRAILNLMEAGDIPPELGHNGASWNDLIFAALNDALDYLSERIDPDMEKWQWGDIHHVIFSNPLTQHPQFGSILARIFNRGPVPLSGGNDTLNRAAFSTSQNPQDPYQVLSISSLRMIVDMGNLRDAIAMHSTGESGLPTSPHYDDMIQPWAHGDYYRMLFDRTDVELNATTRLLIVPERQGQK